MPANHRATETAKRQDAYLSLFDELLAVVTEKLGWRGESAHLHARLIAEGMCDRNPGTFLYVPAVVDGEHEALKATVVAAFNGRNAREVCEQYGVSRTTLYRWAGEAQAAGAQKKVPFCP